MCFIKFISFVQDPGDHEGCLIGAEWAVVGGAAPSLPPLAALFWECGTLGTCIRGVFSFPTFPYGQESHYSTLRREHRQVCFIAFFCGKDVLFK